MTRFLIYRLSTAISRGLIEALWRCRSQAPSKSLSTAISRGLIEAGRSMLPSA